MFKLIKILNSGVNVPETVKLPKSASASIKLGSALTLIDGEVTSCSATSAPQYIAAQNAKIGEDSVLCYAVNENMIFETVFNASPDGVLLGHKVTLGTDADGATVCVTANTASGVATVTDLMGAKAAGDKVNVKF